MAYGFNDDRSKVEIYSKTEIDEMDLNNDQALVNEASIRNSADVALGARIDTILSSQDLDPNKDSELVDIRTAYDNQEYSSAGVAVREQVKLLNKKQSYRDSMFNHGANFFNKDTVVDNFYLNSNGELAPISGYCVSDWLEVEPNTLYYTNTNFGTFCYDSSKNFIEQFNTTSFTTSATTAYIRIAMSISLKGSIFLSNSIYAYQQYYEKISNDFLNENTLQIDYLNVIDDPVNAFIVNRFNKNIITPNTYVDPNHGVVNPLNNYFTSDFIRIDDINKVWLSYTFTGAFFDEDKTFISGGPDCSSMNADKDVTPPSGAKYIRVSATSSNIDRTQVGYMVSRNDYHEYGSFVIPGAIIDESQIIRSESSGKINDYDVCFLLPDIIHLMPNEDFSLYFNGIVKNYFALGNTHYVAMESKNGSVYSPKGETYDYKWHYTPSSGETFSIEFRIIEKATDKVVSSKVVNFITSATKTGKSANIVAIGDSFIDGYNIIPYLVQQIQASGNNLVSLGVNSTDFSGIKDCGWAGLTYQWVVSNATGYGLRSDRPLDDAVWDPGWGKNEENGWTEGQTYSDLTSTQRSHGKTKNEFWNPLTEEFDFGYYMSTYHPGQSCDIFIMEYGVNDIGWGSISSCISKLATVKNCIDEIINDVKDYDSNIKIIIYLIVPNGNDNNAIGTMNNTFPNKDRVITNAGLFNEMILENYQDDSNVIVIASNGNFDNRYGIRSGTFNPVKFNSSIEETGTIDIHPSVIGSKYIADTIAHTVYSMLS